MQINLNPVLPPSIISVYDLNQRITNKDPGALNQTFRLLDLHVVSIDPNNGENFVVQTKNKQITYCANVGLENKEGKEQITAKTWTATID